MAPILRSSTVTRGPDEITAAWQVFFADDGPTIKWRPQIVEVLEDGQLALSRGPYRLISKDEDGNDIEHWGTFNSIWRKDTKGHWRIIFDAGNQSDTGPSESSRALMEQEDNC